MGNQKKMNFKKLEVLAQNQKCVFCHTSEINEIKLGPVYMYQNIITHYYCLLLSSNMQQNGQDSDGILGFLLSDIKKEIKRGKRLVCTYCRKSGATLGCDITRCKVAFHLPCGIENNSLHQFFNSFKSFCKHHRPTQKIPKEILVEAGQESFTNCIICCENIEPRPVFDTLWAPCCKKNAWFHRDCVQKLATSAGYFFKCPLCNNKEDFSRTMRDFGIYIPEQDASWESVPNAFGDLYQRHDSCNAIRCLCPQGRKDNVSGTRWELVLCRLCGSQGMHIGCGKLHWIDPMYECKDCVQMLQTAKENPEPASDNKDILRNLPTYERFATTHPSVSSDRLDDISDEEKGHIIRRRRIVDFQTKSIPSTSKTFVIPDSPEPVKNIIYSDTIIIDDSDDDDDDDLVIVSSELPIKTAIVTNEGTKIPIVTINEKRVNNNEIEVPVQIKMVDHIQEKKLKLDSVFINNNNSMLFENTNIPSNSMFRPVMQNYTCVPSSSMTSQDLYGNTYVLDPSHNVEGYPPGTAVYQSIPQEYLQNNQAQQQLGASWTSYDISCHASHACHPDICQHRARSCNKPNHESGSKHITSSPRCMPINRTKQFVTSSQDSNNTYCSRTDTCGKISKLFSANTNKSFRDSILYVKQLGYNYNRLNPSLIVSPLKIWRNDKGNIKILVLPFARNNFKRMKRLITCTNPIKKPKVDFNLYKKETKLKMNKAELSSKTNRVLLKSRLKVKMFGANWIKKVKKENDLCNVKLKNGNLSLPCTIDKKRIKVKRDNDLRNVKLKNGNPSLPCTIDKKRIKVKRENDLRNVKLKNGNPSLPCTIDKKRIKVKRENDLHNVKLKNGNLSLPCTIDKKRIQFPILTRILDNKQMSVVNFNGDTSMLTLDSFNNIDRKIKKIDIFDENKFVDFTRTSADDKQNSVIINDNNTLSPFCDNSTNKRCPNILTQENTLECKNLLEFIKKDKPDVKLCLLAENEICTVKSKEIISNVDSVSTTQKENSQISYKTFKNKKAVTAKIKTNSTMFDNKSPLNISQENKSNTNYQIFSNKIKTSKNQKITLLNHSKASEKQNTKISKQIIGPSNFRTLDIFFKVLKPVDNLQNIDMPNTSQGTNEKHCDTVETHDENPDSNKTFIKTISSKQSLIESYLNTSNHDNNKIEQISPDATENADEKTNQKLNRKPIKTATTEFMRKIQSKSKTNQHKAQGQIRNKLKLGCQDIKEFNYKRGKGKNTTGEQEIIKNTQDKLICTNNEPIHNLKCTDLEAKEAEIEKYTQHVPNFDDREGAQEVNSFELYVPSNDIIENFKSKSNGEFKNEKNQTVEIINSDKNCIFVKDSNSDLVKNKQLLLKSTFHKPNQFNTNEKNGKGVINNKTITSNSLLKTKFCFNKREPLTELRENSLNDIKSNFKHKKMIKFRGKSKSSKLIIKLFNANSNIRGNKSK